MTLREVLQRVLDSLGTRILTTGAPSAGQLVEVELSPSLADMSVADVLTGSVDLTWVAKNVLFESADLEPNLVAANLERATTGGQPAVNNLGNLVPLPGVPGLLGQLEGFLPLSTGTSFPVTATVSWQVLDAEGAPLAGDQFTSPTGLNGPRLAVAFLPAFVELGAEVPAPQRRSLRATVTLSAGGTTVGPRTLPDVPVLVPAVPVPTALALFLHRDFAPRSGGDDGAVLVIVPGSSPLGSVEALDPLLAQLAALGNALQNVAALAGFVTGIGLLRSALAQPHVVFRKADRIDNFNGIDLIQRGFFENDTEAEDELSSLVFLGRAGRGAHCCNSRDLRTGEGDFTVSAGTSLMALVRNLHSISPDVELGTLTVHHTPPGGLFTASNFGDNLSSMEFVG